jgi:hypothetical protein
MKGARQVYFAECIGPTGAPMGAYKIGCSFGLEDRLYQVGATLPFTLELRAAITGDLVMEKICHLALAEHKIAGEYFHASERVLSVVKHAAKHGRAFPWIEDLGESAAPDGAVKAFMDYHGVNLADVCGILGLKPSQYEKRLAESKYRNRNMVAATAIVANRRGHYVCWPTDALRGLLGEISHQLAESRARDEREAA